MNSVYQASHKQKPIVSLVSQSYFSLFMVGGVSVREIHLEFSGNIHTDV